LAESNTNIIENSADAINSLISFDATSQLLTAEIEGLVSRTRYTFSGFPALQYLVPFLFPEICRKLYRSNTEVRMSLNNIDPELEEAIYKLKIPVQMNNIALDLNFFDYSNLVTTMGLKISKQYPFQDYTINPDIQFFHSTLMDQPIVVGESLINILRQDTDLKLSKGIKVSIAAAIAISIFGVALLSYLFEFIKVLIRQRNQFFEIFSKIDEEVIQETLKSAQNFKLRFENSLNPIESKGKEWKKILFHSGSAKQIRKKTINMKKVNSKIHALTIISLTLILLMILGIAIMVIFQEKQNNTFRIQAQHEYAMNQLSNRYNTIVDNLLQYIIYNGSGIIAGQPLGTYFENLFNELVNSDQFFGELMDYYSFNETLADLIKGDLCQYNLRPSLAKSFCITIASSAMTRGVVGVNKEIASAVRTAKDFFDNSPRTFADQVTALSISSLPQIEIASFSYLLPIYESVKSGIRENQRRFTSSYHSNLIKLIMALIFVYCFLGLLFFKNVKINLEGEMITWRKFIRMIPYRCYAQNKLLRNHLKKISNVRL